MGLLILYISMSKSKLCRCAVTITLMANNVVASFWPFQSLFRKSAHWRGEWSASNEKWFQERMAQLASYDEGQRTEGKWKDWSRPSGTKKASSLSVVKGEEDTKEAMGNLFRGAFADTALSSSPYFFNTEPFSIGRN